MQINLIDPDFYPPASHQNQSRLALDPRDAAILDVALAKARHDAKAAKADDSAPVQPGHADYTWLRKNVYLENDLWDSTYKAGNAAEERKMRMGLAGVKMEELNANDADPAAVQAQIRKILEGFAYWRGRDAADVRHPKRPGLRAVDIQPVVPDLERWCDTYLLILLFFLIF